MEAPIHRWPGWLQVKIHALFEHSLSTYKFLFWFKNLHYRFKGIRFLWRSFWASTLPVTLGMSNCIWFPNQLNSAPTFLPALPPCLPGPHRGRASPPRTIKKGCSEISPFLFGGRISFDKFGMSVISQLIINRMWTWRKLILSPGKSLALLLIRIQCARDSHWRLNTSVHCVVNLLVFSHCPSYNPQR